ncbi:hypothetical protein HPP92_003511 [Vanilla planifolia]|uniref:Uncharacterized protein n=1 Tax=Vanilla planifolia TaxID=51239 RepID=A0A835VJ10_VANPL|nr:hypothetical protein HPP92_003511 [Vanilla planifolia]
MFVVIKTTKFYKILIYFHIMSYGSFPSSSIAELNLASFLHLIFNFLISNGLLFSANFAYIFSMFIHLNTPPSLICWENYSSTLMGQQYCTSLQLATFMLSAILCANC